MTSHQNRLTSLTMDKKYLVIRDYHHEALPLVYDMKKGDIVTFEGRAFGDYLHLRKANHELVVIRKKPAFDILREYEECYLCKQKQGTETIDLPHVSMIFHLCKECYDAFTSEVLVYP